MSYRGLTVSEVEEARAIFADRINSPRVRLYRDTIFTWVAPVAIGYTTHLKSSSVAPAMMPPCTPRPIAPGAT